MKPRTVKPDKRGMKFFTPDLYLRFNSDNDRSADRADAAWEKALAAYRRHLSALGPRLPDAVRQLTRINLHDAEVLSLQEAVEPSDAPPASKRDSDPVGRSCLVLSLRQENQVTTLIYMLADQLRRLRAPKDWRFSGERRHWLYDELDLPARTQADRAYFLQRTLFSDGSVLEIPFRDVLLHQYRWPVQDTANGERRTA